MSGMFCRLVVLACVIVFSGCASQQYYTDADNPEIAISLSASVTYRGKVVDPEDLPSLLESSDYPKQSTVNIQVAAELTDYRVPYKVMSILARNGYRRPILIGEKQSFSTVGSGEPTHRKAVPIGTKKSAPQRVIKYKTQTLSSPSEPLGQQDAVPVKRTIRYK
jgi:biopolymer transport protein ExbD